MRFHAWQALIGLGLLGLAALTFLGLAFFLLLFSPRGFAVMRWAAAGTALAWLLLWAWCLLRAYRGQEWQMPISVSARTRDGGREAGFSGVQRVRGVHKVRVLRVLRASELTASRLAFFSALLACLSRLTGCGTSSTLRVAPVRTELLSP